MKSYSNNMSGKTSLRVEMWPYPLKLLWSFTSVFSNVAPGEDKTFENIVKINESLWVGLNPTRLLSS